MKKHFTGSVALVATLVLAGCQPKTASSVAVEDQVTLGPQFSAKKGLLVPEDTRRSLGVRIAEAREQKLAAIIDIQLHVYAVTRNASLACGTVTPEQAKQLKVGEPLQIRIGDGPSIGGKITCLNDQLLKASGVIEVLAEIPSGSAQFAVGAFLQASATLESGESVVTLPRTALLQCSDGYSVYTVSGEHLVRTPVKIGATSSEFVEIQDGLYAGDQVVLQSAMSLWLTELAAVKGGQACCAVPAKGK